MTTDREISMVTRTFAVDALAGKGAIITGCASGMGLATALAFASVGAEVVMADFREPELEQAARAVESVAGRPPAGVIVVDVSDETAGQKIIDVAAGSLKTITTLVNCAGIARYAGPEDAPPATAWRQVLDTNLTSMYLIGSAVAPHIREAGGGAIVNVSSMMALRGLHGMDADSYCASKAGVLGLTKSMAMHLGRDRIRVNAILPGMVRTRLAESSVERAETLNAEGRGIPIQRIGEPADIAACALFLASDAAGYITGADFLIDGGVSADSGMGRFFPDTLVKELGGR